MDVRPVVLPLLLAALVGCGTSQAGGSSAAPEQVEPACPAAFEVGAEEPWVPEPPTAQTEGRLVPDADPVDGLVCRYTPDGALESSVALAAGLDRIRHDLLLPEELPGQERVCTLIGSAQVPHLMRLSYADGGLWVSGVQDANSCRDTGNGDFVTQAYLGGRLAEAYDSGVWPAAPQPRGCTGGGSGRAGQEDAFVSPGWRSLAVCVGSADPRQVPRADAERVAELLLEVEAEAGSNSCSGSASRTYNLLFRYEQGPPVMIWFAPGCEPALHNGSLDASPDAARSAELQALLDGG